MPELTLKDVQNYFADNADTEEVKTYLTTIGTPTVESVRDSLVTDSKLADWFAKERDKSVTKGIESWKANNLQSIIEKERNNIKEESSTEKAIRELKEEMLREKQENAKEKHINQALEYSSGKIKPKYVTKLIGADIDETKRNIDDFIQDFNVEVVSEVDKTFAANGRTMNNSLTQKTGQAQKFTAESAGKLSDAEFAENFDTIKRHLSKGK